MLPYHLPRCDDVTRSLKACLMRALMPGRWWSGAPFSLPRLQFRTKRRGGKFQKRESEEERHYGGITTGKFQDGSILASVLRGLRG